MPSRFIVGPTEENADPEIEPIEQNIKQ